MFPYQFFSFFGHTPLGDKYTYCGVFALVLHVINFELILYNALYFEHGPNDVPLQCMVKLSLM